LQKAWRFLIDCLRLLTDRELYMLVWLTMRAQFVRCSQETATDAANLKSKAAAAAMRWPSTPE
jgi:hypothetical protein